nr:MAG TPA: hypothetical protein [Caudoviricetes sp.]
MIDRGECAQKVGRKHAAGIRTDAQARLARRKGRNDLRG